MTAGVIGLIGGEEFRPAAGAFDRLLLGLVAKSSPAVAILPTAAARERPELAASNGVRHFAGLGVTAYAVMIVDRASADDQTLVGELRRADVVYLAGGSPAHLVESLRGSAAWAFLTEAHERGVGLAGSSAGAMALCARLAFGGSDSRGLGLVAGAAVLPHFERMADDRLERLRSELTDGTTLLAIDGSTGCARDGAQWLVAGPGRVALITASDSETFRSGDTFTLR